MCVICDYALPFHSFIVSTFPLQVQWLLNGQPVAASSRVKMISDFGWIILDINQAEPRDTGEWVCRAYNSAGEARSIATCNVLGHEGIVYDAQQPQSLPRIREIEAPKAAPEAAPPKQYEPPQFVRPFDQVEQLSEGDSVHLEAQITPIDDPSLKVICFFFNGKHSIIESLE